MPLLLCAGFAKIHAMKALAILLFMILSSVKAFASDPACVVNDLSKMNWPQRFNVYSRIMLMEKEEQHQACLLDFFYKIRQDFILETLKGEANYKDFFEQVRQHFGIENAKPIKVIKSIPRYESTDGINVVETKENVETMEVRNGFDPKYYENLIKLDHISPLMLFFQQVWMEQALDRWLERKTKSSHNNTWKVGGGVLALTLALSLHPATRKVMHRTLKLFFRIFHETSKSKLAFLIVPSAAASQISEGDAIAKYKKLKAQYQLPLSPFEVTEPWLYTQQQDLMNSEADQLWSDLASISTSAAAGTAVGLLVKKLLNIKFEKRKLLILGAAVGATMLTTNTMEKALAESLYIHDYEKVVRMVNGVLYDIDANVQANKKAKAYLDMYGVINEIEIYALLKIRDAGLKIAEYEKKAIKSCLPSWTDEEITANAKKLQADLKMQFRFARALIKHFRSQSSDLLKTSFPYFPDRLDKIKKFIDIMSSEKELEMTLRTVIIEKNECYKP